MKYYFIMILGLFICFSNIQNVYSNGNKKFLIEKHIESFVNVPPDSSDPYYVNPKLHIKKLWKINQMYYDSVAANIDSTMARFRLLPTEDSILYIHDGTDERIYYWNFFEPINKLSLYIDKNNMTSSTLFFTYDVLYLDNNNLILLLDLRGKNLPVELIEYRLIPDTSYLE